MDSHEQRIREMRYRTAVQPKLDEPVLAAALFHRPGRWSALVSRLARRPHGSGLPQTFLMAITPTRMHAFAADGDGRELGVRDEVAVWERAAVHVTSGDGAAHTWVTIETPGDSPVMCNTGKDELSRSVVRYMLDPAVVAA